MYPRLPGVTAGILSLLLFGMPCAAHETQLEEVVVEGRSLVLIKEARSASEGVIGQQDLQIRPMLRTGDVLEAIPGMIVTQHSGSGKSNQMFLRGFNLDHGTDFATWIDDMPVNMRTHGHGQGYTDVNFLIPETIQTLSFVKGPYHAEQGDFSSAGGSHISTFDRMESGELRLELGENGYRRMLGMGGVEIAGGFLSGALEAQRYDGPWKDIEEDVEKYNGLLRYTGGDEALGWTLTAMAYDNSWNSADQIPDRAVEQGLIDEFGSLDDTLGGESSRYSLSAAVHRETNTSSTRASAYLIDYELRLWSNFTYLLDNPVAGDQFEQLDERQVFGAGLHHQWLAGGALQHRVGLELRHDDIDDVALFHTRERQRLDTVRRDAVEETSLGAYYEADWTINHHWRAVFGLRGDYYWFDVDAQRDADSGRESDSILSPKANLIYTLDDRHEFYLSAGMGFHSNDARGTTISSEAVDPLVRSKGMEFGLRRSWSGAGNSSLAFWYLELDSELLFVGDAGNTEASRPSRRQGIELNNYWTLKEYWFLEADIAWTDAEFDDSSPPGDEIPGAIEWVASGAIGVQYPTGPFGSLRLRYFSDAPLVEDGGVESEGSFIANLALGWAWQNWRTQLTVINLFDADDHDIDYYYASRLPRELSGGVEDIHYHPFEPRQLRLSLSWRF